MVKYVHFIREPSDKTDKKQGRIGQLGHEGLHTGTQVRVKDAGRLWLFKF